MTGKELRQYRKSSNLTQKSLAQALAVSQTYLSLLESDERPLTDDLSKRLARSLSLPATMLPSEASRHKIGRTSDDQLTAELSALGYPGFSHYKPGRRRNPVDLLLSALNADQRDARLIEALPWLLVKYHELDWNALVATAKIYDLQNRLGFVINIAREMAHEHRKTRAAVRLKDQ